MPKTYGDNMPVTFDEAFDRLLGHEGGLVDDANDPGGLTNWGISQRQYPDVDIKNLTKDQAKAIYYRDYWKCVGVNVDTAVMWQTFDASVNHGIGNAIRMLQRAVGVVDDGHWGRLSQVSYSMMDKNDVLFLFLAERLEFFCKLQKFVNFGRGWARRIATNLRYAAKDN